MKKIPVKDLDYVELYAENLREDSSLFEQQGELVDSQIESSVSIFKEKFKEDFKKAAREYLKSVGLI